MRGSKKYLWLVIGLIGCSAGGAKAPTGEDGPSPAGTTSPGVLAGMPSASASNTTAIDLTSGVSTSSNGAVPDLGSEEACDGMDGNKNGIIDDVDKGKDGLCDCLNIGFIGDIASDAGTMTAAFQNWLEARSDVPVTRLSATAEITEQSLKPLQVLIVGNMTARITQNSSAYSPAELLVLKKWVTERGGGLMTLGGFTGNETHMLPTVQLLAPFDLSYDYLGRGPGILGEGAPPVVITGITAPQHPTVAGVKALGVYYGYPVVGDGEVILSERGFNLAMAKQAGKGRVFLFADEWITQDTLWTPGALPTQLDVAGFWLNVINWLSPADECKVTIPAILK
ncbi:MAG: hypothetical protein SFV15_24870 [Polyangiaceae bacterium]|nr:hypothetical protein [Polyangiaceae bacterium]